MANLEDSDALEALHSVFYVSFFYPLEWEHMLTIDQLRVEAGPSVLVPTTAATAGPLVSNAETHAASQTSSDLLERYAVLNDAVTHLAVTQGDVLEYVRGEVGDLLVARAAMPRHPEVDDETDAQRRFGDVVSFLRWNRPTAVRGLELDASEALVNAALVHSQEVDAGVTAADSFPDLGADAESAMPLLRFIPEDQRQAFLRGLPAGVTQLAPEFQPKGVWEKARALGTRALEHLHLRRRARPVAVGHTAVAPELAADVTAEPEKFNAQSAPDHEFYTGDGQKLTLISYYDIGDPAYGKITEMVEAGALREYKNHGLVEGDARLDPCRGENVEIVAVLNEAGEVVASLRKVHVTGDRIHELPSYKKADAENGWDTAGRALLHEHAAAGRSVVEIVRLWKEQTYGSDVKVEMYVHPLQVSIERDELWFMGIVQGEYAGLLRSYGPHVVHTLGQPLQVKGEGATEGVRLRPVMIEPRTFYGDMLDGIVDLRESGKIAKMYERAMVMATFLIGFDWKRLDPRTRMRLEGAIDGYYS